MEKRLLGREDIARATSGIPTNLSVSPKKHLAGAPLYPPPQLSWDDMWVCKSQHHHMLDSGLGLVSHPGTETEMTETQILPLQAFRCAAVASRSYCGQHDLQHLGFRLSFHFIFFCIFTELLFRPRGQLPRKNDR